MNLSSEKGKNCWDLRPLLPIDMWLRALMLLEYSNNIYITLTFKTKLNLTWVLEMLCKYFCKSWVLFRLYSPAEKSTDSGRHELLK